MLFIRAGSAAIMAVVSADIRALIAAQNGEKPLAGEKSIKGIPQRVEKWRHTA
jgi:hypothetical protein